MIHGTRTALAEAGKIKIGGLGQVRQGQNAAYRQPEKYTYFIVTKTTRKPSPTPGVPGDLETDDAIMAQLPKDPDQKCRRIPIILHSDNIEDVFPTTLALYTGKKLYCSGDGKNAVRRELVDGKAVPTPMACPCPYLNNRENKKLCCKPHGTLNCSIALKDLAVAGAVHHWRTTSIISIQQMRGSLEQIQSLFGTLRGVPLWLVVGPVTVSPGGVTTTVHVCHVEARAQDVMAIQQKALQMASMRQRLGFVDRVAPVQRPAVDEGPDEEAETQMEFHPEADGGADPGDLEAGMMPTPDPEPAPAQAKPAPPPPPPPDPGLPMLKYIVRAARRANVNNVIFWCIDLETSASTVLATSTKDEGRFKFASTRLGKFVEANVRPFQKNGKTYNELMAIRDEASEDVEPPGREPGQEG